MMMASSSIAKSSAFFSPPLPKSISISLPPLPTSFSPKPYFSLLLLRPLTLTHPQSPRLLPLLINCANTSPPQAPVDYFPDAQFYKVEAILRPWRIPKVSAALLKMGIRGVTVSDVRGFGAQGGLTERQAGSEFSEDNFVAKVKMEIVVSKDQVEAVLEKIISEAKTGEIGDGKIFLIPVSDVIRVRTGERGEKAERMAGGWSDMSSTTTTTTTTTKYPAAA